MNAHLPLRLALAGNALFSLTSALLMIFCPTLLGEWIGIHSPLFIQFVGLGLFFFAVELIYQSIRPRVATWRAALASVADFSWVIGSIVLLITFPHLFSPLGNAIILTVAGIVFVFGAWQLWGAGRAHKIGREGEYRHCIIVETNVPVEKMWQVIGNMGDIKNYMPTLKRSIILEGKSPSVGVVRVCEDHTGKQWSEECTEFNPGQGFVVRFLSEAPNFPFPAKTMRGGWDVTMSEVGSQVMVWWELKPKCKLLAPVILPLLAFQADRDFPKVVRRMALATLGKNSDGQLHSKAGVFLRLLPTFC